MESSLRTLVRQSKKFYESFMRASKSFMYTAVIRPIFTNGRDGMIDTKALIPTKHLISILSVTVAKTSNN